MGDARALCGANLARMEYVVWWELDSDPHITAVLVVACLEDITFRQQHGARWGHLLMSPDPQLSDLCTVITTLDHAWRSYQPMMVVWAMPSYLDFLLFNTCVARHFYNEVISPVEQDSAIQYAPLFDATVMRLRQALELRQLAVIQLAVYLR